LSDGTTALWVGNKDAENIILQFHGGGFNLPISEPCLDYMWRIKEALAKKGTDIAILNLAYGLFFCLPNSSSLITIHIAPSPTLG
jgi:hypothetical protein